MELVSGRRACQLAGGRVPGQLPLPSRAQWPHRTAEAGRTLACRARRPGSWSPEPDKPGTANGTTACGPFPQGGVRCDFLASLVGSPLGRPVGLPGSGAWGPAQPGLHPAPPPPHPHHTNRKQVAKPSWLQASGGRAAALAGVGGAPAPRLAVWCLRLTPTLCTLTFPLEKFSHYEMLRTCRDPPSPREERWPTSAPWTARSPPAPRTPPVLGALVALQARSRPGRGDPGLCSWSVTGAVASGRACLSRARRASVCAGRGSRLPLAGAGCLTCSWALDLSPAPRGRAPTLQEEGVWSR